MTNRLADEAAYFGAIEDYKASQPRSVVAISDDHKWLVVLMGSWSVYHWWDEDGYEGWTWDRDSWSLPNDTGQGADDVLACFLASRA